MSKTHQLNCYFRSKRLMLWFTWFTRILLFIACLPSGYKKFANQRFTLLGIDNPIGFFFEALYVSGFYWQFLGLMQLMAGFLLLIPRTTFLGALIYFPIILNIFVIVTSMHFTGTPIVAGLMLLANLWLIFWDFDKFHSICKIIFEL